MSSGQTITVGCKLPHGLKLDMNGPGEPRNRIVLNGSNSQIVVGGFGITENVPEEFFDAWMKKHQHLPAVKNGLIFAMKSTRSVVDAAKEHSEFKHGSEQIDPKKPGKNITRLVTHQEITEEMADA